MKKSSIKNVKADKNRKLNPRKGKSNHPTRPKFEAANRIS
jgi:hypothetical protein